MVETRKKKESIEQIKMPKIFETKRSSTDY